MSSCKSQKSQEGLLLTSDSPLKTYVKSAVGANGNHGTRLFFPLLQIYNSDGKLVYVSHDAQANVSALQALPNNASDLQPIAGAEILGDVIKEYPSFASEKDALVARHSPTVLSIFLDSCHACSIQENALDATQARLNQTGVNLLIMKVQRPD